MRIRTFSPENWRQHYNAAPRITHLQAAKTFNAAGEMIEIPRWLLLRKSQEAPGEEVEVATGFANAQEYIEFRRDLEATLQLNHRMLSGFNGRVVFDFDGVVCYTGLEPAMRQLYEMVQFTETSGWGPPAQSGADVEAWGVIIENDILGAFALHGLVSPQGETPRIIHKVSSKGRNLITYIMKGHRNLPMGEDIRTAYITGLTEPKLQIHQEGSALLQAISIDTLQELAPVARKVREAHAEFVRNLPSEGAKDD